MCGLNFQTVDEMESLCIVLSIGNVTMESVVIDKQRYIYLHGHELNIAEESHMFITEQDWASLMSEELNGFIKLAIDDIENDRDSTLSISNSSCGAQYVRTNLGHQFRLGPKVCVVVDRCDDSVIISINDFGIDKRSSQNEIDLTVDTWNMVRERHSNFKSLKRNV